MKRISKEAREEKLKILLMREQQIIIENQYKIAKFLSEGQLWIVDILSMAMLQLFFIMSGFIACMNEKYIVGAVMYVAAICLIIFNIIKRKRMNKNKENGERK